MFYSFVCNMIDLLMPPMCLSCQTPVQAHRTLCGACFSRMEFITRPFYEVNGIPVPHAWMLSDIQYKYEYNMYRVCDILRSSVVYNTLARDIVHKMKYKDKTVLAEFMAQCMMHVGHELLRHSDVIVPIPLTPKKLFFRQYNQSCDIAKNILRLCVKKKYEYKTHIDFTHLKRKSRISQTRLKRKERFDNLKETFFVHPRHYCFFSNKNVLLIDDVITTEATAHACASSLKKAGARKVFALSFARVVRSIEKQFIM